MTRREEIIEKAQCIEHYGMQEQFAFIAGAQWADKTMIEKVGKWLKENANKYIVDIGGRYETRLIVGGKCWENLRKAMED